MFWLDLVLEFTLWSKSRCEQYDAGPKSCKLVADAVKEKVAEMKELGDA